MQKRKIDDEKFRKMWESGASISDVMTEFNVTDSSVYERRKCLNLAPHPRPYPSWLITYRHKVKYQKDQQVFDYLKQNGGFCDYRQLLKIVGNPVMCRMRMETKIIRVEMNLSRYPGSYKWGIGDKIFNEGFYQKVFYCLDRTGLVRLLQKALKKPENSDICKTLSAFLRSCNLTEAEKIAVLWKLGITNWDAKHTKNSIQIDGIVMPRGKWCNQ